MPLSTVKMTFYFAYGSNLDEEQLKRRCPSSKRIEIGCLEGYQLVFNRYSPLWKGGVADVISNPASCVWGIVFEMDEEDLPKLDHYEGYPKFYNRFKSSIRIPEGKLSDVWVYEVVDKNDFIPPSENYLDIIKRASNLYGFPDTYRSFLDSIKAKGKA